MTDPNRSRRLAPPDEQAPDRTARGWVRACLDWLVPPLPSHSSPAPNLSHTEVRERLGHFVVSHKIGQGGMGVVYAARDERLERPVALKMMSLQYDDVARARFWREARAAAAVNHPHVCQIYEIGEDRGDLFIAMELLDGEPLAERLRRGSLDVSEAVAIGRDILAALSALHARGIIHRDLKPSNVFLTTHGVKLLDFGLAQIEGKADEVTGDRLTITGFVAGTPHYMAPERLAGGPADVRSDLFAVGALLFEMLARRTAFTGSSLSELLHAVMYEQPPALTGSPVVNAVDRLIRRAIAKQPVDRPTSAAEMAAELDRISSDDGHEKPVLAHALTRVVALPFQLLRPDPDSDFLAHSLPEAIATSLANIESLIVRSSAVAARFAGSSPDLKALGREAGVDRVILGTLLRSGDQVRASAQLVEVPGGTLLASHTIESSTKDLLELHDELSRRVVEALSSPLLKAAAPDIDTPRDPHAFEFYLRANDLARSHESLARARLLYERCLELDPRFAPAWARLGRCHHLAGKYVDGNRDGDTHAEAAFKRALELNPRLAIAHKYYASLEADTGQASRALIRLLDEARRHGNDAELFAGLVHACRYCGLNEASLAAHTEARRLDPNVPTSVEETLLVSGDIERLLAIECGGSPTGTQDANRVIGLGLTGRRDDAREVLRSMRSRSHSGVLQTWADYLGAWLDRRPAAMVFDSSVYSTLTVSEDPEAVFQEGWLLCDAGDYERGLDCLQRAVGKGYFPTQALGRSHFDSIRSTFEFQEVLSQALDGRDRALDAFRESGGDTILGLWVDTAKEQETDG